LFVIRVRCVETLTNNLGEMRGDSHNNQMRCVETLINILGEVRGDPHNNLGEMHRDSHNFLYDL
jgi:hypothetical protein